MEDAKDTFSALLDGAGLLYRAEWAERSFFDKNTSSPLGAYDWIDSLRLSSHARRGEKWSFDFFTGSQI
jgi:hypothetical protein